MTARTRLDTDVTKPSTVAPGDAPADTTDPAEHASTVGGDKKAAAQAGHLTVNAAVPVPGPPAKETGEHRFETYEATRPDGSKVTIKRNIDTGDHQVLEPGTPETEPEVPAES